MDMKNIIKAVKPWVLTVTGMCVAGTFAWVGVVLAAVTTGSVEFTRVDKQ